MSKEAWGNLNRFFAANMTTSKELNNIQQRDMSIGSYTLMIKELCDALGSINVVMKIFGNGVKIVWNG